MSEVDAAAQSNRVASAPVSRVVRGAFIAWWLVLTAVLALFVEGAVYAASLDCHGYEDGLGCQVGPTMSLAAAGLLAVAVAGVLLGRRASRRVLLIAALGFPVVVGGTVRTLAPGPDSQHARHLDHF